MNNDASEKTSWERMIKQNMVPLKVDGSRSTYVLDERKNSAVEIHFGTQYAIPPRQLSKVGAGRGPKEGYFGHLQRRFPDP